MTDTEKTITIVDDRMWRSVARATYSYGMLLALTGVGYVLGITALTWIGGLLWILLIFLRAQKSDTSDRLTIEQARRKLDEMDGITTAPYEQGGATSTPPPPKPTRKR